MPFGPTLQDFSVPERVPTSRVLSPCYQRLTTVVPNVAAMKQRLLLGLTQADFCMPRASSFIGSRNAGAGRPPQCLFNGAWRECQCRSLERTHLASVRILMVYSKETVYSNGFRLRTIDSTPPRFAVSSRQTPSIGTPFGGKELLLIWPFPAPWMNLPQAS